MGILSRKISSIALTFSMILAISIGILLNMAQPAQAAVYNGGTWIGTDGKVMSDVHAKEWRYEISYDGKSISLTRYTGTFINGQIIGVMPKKINGLPVTSLDYTFYECKNLVKAPIIPDTVTSMSSTFLLCVNLVEAPVIPDSVTDMDSTFMFCYKLAKAPVIPDSVTDMGWTFARCESLTKAPVIPDSVDQMCYTYACCIRLTSTPDIPDGIKYLVGKFYGCEKIKLPQSIKVRIY